MCTSQSSKNLQKNKAKNKKKYVSPTKNTCGLFQNTITWHFDASNGNTFVGVHIPFVSNLTKRLFNLNSINATFIVWNSYDAFEPNSATIDNVHWATVQRSKPVAYLLVRSFIPAETLFPVRFVQPKQLSPVTGFLIPEHWHDGEVLVIGIPHFFAHSKHQKSRDLGPTWMVGNNNCQFSRYIPSNSIAWCLMLWCRILSMLSMHIAFWVHGIQHYLWIIIV